MAEIKVNNMAKFYAILLLLEKPRYGYELMQSIGEKLESKISPGQMYPLLRKLQKARLVSVKESGGREKKTYTLTPDGRAFARRMMGRFGGLIALAIEPKLTVCSHCGAKVFSGGHEETISGKRMRFCCSHCAAAFKQER